MEVSADFAVNTTKSHYGLIELKEEEAIMRTWRSYGIILQMDIFSSGQFCSLSSMIIHDHSRLK